VGVCADGFTSTTPVICFEYAGQIVNGTSIRLYYPAWWAADDPNRARFAPILQDAALATQTFNALTISVDVTSPGVAVQ